MKTEFKENQLTCEEFNTLRAAVGWSTVTRQQGDLALSQGLYNIKAVVDGETVATARLIGDGVMYWYIQDVIVLPKFQGEHIGSEMIEKILSYTRAHSIPDTRITVGLMAAAGKENFYKKFGFLERPQDIFGAGMHLGIDI